MLGNTKSPELERFRINLGESPFLQFRLAFPHTETLEDERVRWRSRG